MNRIIPIGLTLLALASPAEAQRPRRVWDQFRPPYPVLSRDRSNRVPNLDGIWYLTGNPQAQCEIRQDWPDRQAEFINEHGSRAMGSIMGNQVWIPSWGEGGRGQAGTISGDRIVWPDGNFWSRSAYSSPPYFPGQ